MGARRTVRPQPARRTSPTRLGARHVQQKLALPGPHGGKRAGAGRKAQGPRPSQPHRTRPYLDRHHPVHVTIRAVPAIGRLRRRDAFGAIRRAMITALRRRDFRICHVSIQATHVHLIVEARSRLALARGMQGFQISAAKQLNRAVERRTGALRRGTVFADRYHARAQTSPREVRSCLAYVFGNWRHHDEHRRAQERVRLDPYATGHLLDGWRDFDRPPALPARFVAGLPISFPKTWLLERGWRRAGMLDTKHVPGPR